MQKKMMLCLSFIAQLLSIQLYAQDEAGSLDAGSDSHVKSLLWRITGNGMEQPSYIFGTIHAICAEDYFFTDKMQTALNECQQLILEVNLNDPSMMTQYQKSMMLPDGETLVDYFSDEGQYQEFSNNLKRLADIDIQTFNQFKPFVLISALAMKGFSCPTTSSYEMKLIELTKKRNVIVSGLETFASQMEIFDKMEKVELAEMLLSSLKEDNSNIEKANEMVNLYKEQDLNGLHKMIIESNEIKGHEEVFLTNRNKNWARMIPELIKKQSSFIAVGAAHLPGQVGILNLLKEAGYQVEAVK